MREVCSVDPRWLVDVAPNFFKHAEARSISKSKREDKLQPLFNRYEEKDAWRLANRKL